MIPARRRASAGARRAGRTSWVGALVLPLVTVALVATYLRGCEAEPVRWTRTDGRLPAATEGELVRFVGRHEVDEVSLAVELAPFRGHGASSRRPGVHWAASLAERYALEEGGFYRLTLVWDPAPPARRWDWGSMRVSGDEGASLATFAGLIQARGVQTSDGPLEALLGTLPPDDPPVRRVEILLYGPEPSGGAVFELADSLGDGLRVSLAPESVAPEELADWFAVAAWNANSGSRIERLQAENERLQAELDHERDRRKERELEWFEFNRSLAQLNIELLTGFPVDPDYVPAAATDEEQGGEEGEPEEPAADPEAERQRAVLISLRALLELEGLYGYDLFEIGELGNGSVGPVVFRLLDDRGRLDGSLYAERLRLEGSRSGRTLTLVLEQGYESHGGVRVPFREGVRRIVLPFVDPAQWMESLPELFSPGDLVPPPDDGLWDKRVVRSELNRLLAANTQGGWYRVTGIGGIQGRTYLDVQIDAVDSAGRIERRFFADSMRVEEAPPGVQLLLEGGASVRGGEKEAFTRGMHRIFLPGSSLAAWRQADLPGWSDVPLENAPGSEPTPEESDDRG